MALACLLAFAAAFAVSLGGVLAMERWAGRLRLVDHPGERKLHARPMPLGGGLAIWLGTVAAVLGGCALASAGGAEWLGPRLGAFLRDQAPLVQERGWVLLAILGGGTAVMVLGLLDDLLDLSAWTRLGGQATVALGAFLVSQDVRITLFSSSPVVWAALTVLWIVGITNSFNLLDNMDGLSSGVALVAAALFVAGALATGQWFVALFLLAFAGATAAFLVRNFAPAKIYAGSAGSYFFGFILATSPITFTYYDYSKDMPLWSALVPVLVLSVAIYDTASVILIRWREGRPIFEGDQSHLSHRLVAMGMGQREAVGTIYLLAFCAGCPALLLLNPPYETVLVFAESVGVLGLVAMMEVAGQRLRQRGNRRDPDERPE
jgi:UDP-GlcNAc:undecaprenyl-phosphate GlcNAc-1-phosphate transferase